MFFSPSFSRLLLCSPLPVRTWLFWIALYFSTLSSTRALTSDELVILYNQEVPQSKKLALTYAQKRQVPQKNLLGLSLPTGKTISHTDYHDKVHLPLRERINTTFPSQSIKAIVCMKGVPYFIEYSEPPTATPAQQASPNPSQLKQLPKATSHSAFDSELALLPQKQLPPLAGSVPNPYYNKNEAFSLQSSILLVGRIDAPTWDTCERLIEDAIAVEKNGLWGRCYLDFSQKKGAYIQGDHWLKQILKTNLHEGISTVTDQNKQCYLSKYPMTDCALYYGWYAAHACGPFKDSSFRFKKGAVAVHIHSFSARELHNPNQSWVGPLLKAGACATLGNVFEPYLSRTHHLDIFHQRLLAGYTLVEASAMAIPVLSWQNLVIGDPLYRPFKAYKEAPSLEEDKAYKALRMATLQWRDQPDERVTQLRTAAARMNSSTLYEAIGLEKQHALDYQGASAFFNSAHHVALHPDDAFRQILHQIELFRRSQQPKKAILLIQKALKTYENQASYRVILTSLQTILDPPPPPPAEQIPSPSPTSSSLKK